MSPLFVHLLAFVIINRYIHAFLGSISMSLYLHRFICRLVYAWKHHDALGGGEAGGQPQFYSREPTNSLIPHCLYFKSRWSDTAKRIRRDANKFILHAPAEQRGTSALPPLRNLPQLAWRMNKLSYLNSCFSLTLCYSLLCSTFLSEH